MRRRASVRWLVIVATIAAGAGGAMAQSATSVLFIGNSFTFGLWIAGAVLSVDYGDQ